MKHLAIVGAGIAGLVASLVLLKKGYQVTLFESSNQVGGLLGQSFQWRSCRFDYGTHFIASTGNAEHDALLFGSNFEMTHDWQEIPVLLAGNYFSGRLNEQGSVMDFRDLPSNVYQQICMEFLNVDSDVNAENLAQRIECSLGETAKTQIYAPLMTKLYNHPIDNLDSEAHALFGLSRVVLASSEMNDRLKALPYFNDLLGYGHRLASSLRVFYPSNGVNDWIEKLLHQCQAFEFFDLNLGVEVDDYQKVNQGCALGFNNDKKGVYDGLIWTAPLLPLSKLLSINTSKNSENIKWRRADFYHFVFDAPFMTLLHYVTCYQHDMHSFRVTLYSNFNPSEDGYYCTVEVLRDFEQPMLAHAIIEQELRLMKIVDGNLIYAHKHSLNTGFPVRSTSFRKSRDEISHKIAQKAPEITLLGKNTTAHFFMKDVIFDTIDKLHHKVY